MVWRLASLQQWRRCTTHALGGKRWSGGSQVWQSDGCAFAERARSAVARPASSLVGDTVSRATALRTCSQTRRFVPGESPLLPSTLRSFPYHLRRSAANAARLILSKARRHASAFSEGRRALDGDEEEQVQCQVTKRDSRAIAGRGQKGSVGRALRPASAHGSRKLRSGLPRRTFVPYTRSGPGSTL